MKNTEIMNKVTSTISKAGFKLKKHSPEILVVAGVIGTVVSAVMACKATTKVNDILTESKEQLDKIHDCSEDEELAEKYTPEDAKKDTLIVYMQTSAKMVRLYAPAISLGLLSIGCILASNNILHKRNVAIAAAYATIDNSFKDYRQRVAERFGKDIERELKYNIKAISVEEKVTNEDGEETTITKNIFSTDSCNYSGYAQIFDESNPYWEKDSDYNLMFLRAQQNYANNKLIANGYLFLNDVYEMLGFPKTKAGQVVGWTYRKNQPNGDNYVDFGIFDFSHPANANFVDGDERSIWLDFNVDGNIWDLM
jgi:hypothetical protein